MEKFIKIKKENEKHIENIKNIVLKYTNTPEGDCFWYHGSTVEDNDFIFKQYNLYYLGSKSQNIVEIGFNAGHSALLLLLGNNTSKITIFDICMHDYTLECFDYLNTVFPNRLELIVGNSLETVPEYYLKNKDKKFDLIHLDGFHEPNHVKKDFMNIKKMGSNIIILDDDNLPYLNTLHNDLLKYENIELCIDPFLYESKIYTHKICKIT